MSPDEAGGYVMRYRLYWSHGGPSNDVLTEEFSAMDPGVLGTALVRLARNVDEAPTIARIWRAMRELDTKRPEPVSCSRDPDCDGWATVDDYNGRGYRGCLPCHVCGEARGTTRTWRWAMEPKK